MGRSNSTKLFLEFSKKKILWFVSREFIRNSNVHSKNYKDKLFENPEPNLISQIPARGCIVDFIE